MSLYHSGLSFISFPPPPASALAVCLLALPWPKEDEIPHSYCGLRWSSSWTKTLVEWINDVVPARRKLSPSVFRYLHFKHAADTFIQSNMSEKAQVQSLSQGHLSRKHWTCWWWAFKQLTCGKMRCWISLSFTSRSVAHHPPITCGCTNTYNTKSTFTSVLYVFTCLFMRYRQNTDHNTWFQNSIIPHLKVWQISITKYVKLMFGSL